MKERQRSFEVVIVISEVLRKRVHYFSLYKTRTDSASTGGCTNIPFPLLKFSTCSSWFMNGTSLYCSQFPFDNRSFANFFLHFPSFRYIKSWVGDLCFNPLANLFLHFPFFRCSKSWVGDLCFNPTTCIINVWICFYMMSSPFQGWHMVITLAWWYKDIDSCSTTKIS